MFISPFAPNGARFVYPLFLNRTADDTDPAFTFYYNGNTAGTATVATDSTAHTITLVDPINSTTTIDLTASTTNSVTEVLQAVRGLTADPAGGGWRVNRIAANLNDPVFVSTTGSLLTATAVTARPLAGVTLYWDTSTCLFRAMALGMVEYYTDLYGNTAPMLQRCSEDTIPLYRDSILDNTGPNLGPWSYNYGACITAANYLATYGSTDTSLLTMTPNSQYVQGTSTILSQGVADATAAAVNSSTLMMPLFGQPGQDLVLKLASSSGAQSVTSSTLSAQGWVVAFN